VLKVRVIPTLLWKGPGLVKGVAFDSWRRVGSVLPSIRVYTARDVDELIICDILATSQSTPPDYSAISDFASDCRVPLTIGGGIQDVEQILLLLQAGADKVSVNTFAYTNPELVSRAATKFGAQCVVASIDVRLGADGRYRCFSENGAKDTGKDPVAWAKELADRGAGEILLTSVDRDGTMSGYDIKLLSAVCSSVSVPVIASGGAGSCEHCIEAVVQGGASAIAAASMFHFTEQTPRGVKLAMFGKGIPVRLGMKAAVG
jgi:imidazole glycerol-phosphate synthase subunit HisF